MMFGYAPSVYAAESVLGPLDIAFKDYLYVCWMGSWGALAAYLQKYANDELGAKWKKVLLRDLVNSNLAAILAFWLTHHFNVPKALQAICYTLAGYGGARTMEWAYNKWIASSDHLINRQIGMGQQNQMPPMDDPMQPIAPPMMPDPQMPPNPTEPIP